MKPFLFSLIVLAVGLTGHSRSPNIIFIMADDLGYGDLGCYGGTMIKTPNIDRLAREGTRFTEAYSGSPVCAPARCVLITGVHTGHARIRDNNPIVGGQIEAFGEGGVRLSLTGEEASIAAALREAGYRTGAAGKWGLSEPDTPGTPNRMGFDEWLGYLNQNHAAYYYTDYLWRNEERMEIPGNDGVKGTVYSNDLFRDFALDFIRQNRDRPFFLYLPVTIPHNRMEVPDLGSYEGNGWPEPWQAYAAMVTRLDNYVGQIMAKLDELDLAGDTLVIFTSDNGPLRGDRTTFLNSAGGLRGSKATVYEGGLRVPLIARWPGVVPADEARDGPWMFVDVFPTLLAVAGAEVPGGLDGISVLPLLTGEPQDLSERALYWEFPKDRLWQAVRLGPWKAVRQGTDQPLELYNLEDDPAETHDVASEYPETASSLAAVMDASHTPDPHWPVD
ncbi:MAG: arylsulfatase [Opitutaceae bacterium]